MLKLDQNRIAPGIWQIGVKPSRGLTPMSIMKPEGLPKALLEMKDEVFPFASDSIRMLTGSSRSIAVLPLQDDERIFGFGLQFMKMNQRGRTRYLRVNSDPKQDTGESHAPVPFYVSSRGYGVLLNTSRIATIYCGSAVRTESGLHGQEQERDRDTGKDKDRNTDPSWKATPLSDTVEIVVPGSDLDLIVFAGPTMLDVVKRYNLLSGGGVLPPRWGLGFWHRVPRSYSDRQTIEEAMAFRERDFPCDVIGLEPGWHSRSYPVTYEWNKKLFPDPDGFVKQMEEGGFKVNLWEHPYVSPHAAIHEQLKPLSGSHTVWGGLVPDYTLAEARYIYQSQHMTEHVAKGVSGYKLDECDGSELTNHSWVYPAHAAFPSGCDGEQMRQIYGTLLQKMSTDMFRSRDQRTYGLVRASSSCASTLPYVLYSDLYDHRQFVRALCNASFSGLLWCPEVRKAADAEDWVRRIQTVVFSPLAMLNAWADGTKLWSYPEVESIVRKYIKLRMRLIPYLYSAFARYSFEGVPPIRAIQLESVPAVIGDQEGEGRIDSEDQAYGKADGLEIDDQFMFGDSLLVAPLFAGQHSREVYLPQGIWYEFETGERIEGGCTVEVHPGLERIPVYVRDGAIIPLMPAMDHTTGKGEQIPLELHHYGTAPGRMELFDDDGESYAYERGEYRWRTLEVRKDCDGGLCGVVSDTGEDWVSAYSSFVWVYHHGSKEDET